MKFWIAKTKSGKLGFYQFKPLYNNIYDLWICKLGGLNVDETLFPELTFEDSPIEVELKLIEE